jgi:hypothetical protein
MSEAELHVLKARLQGGILNKARRGELESPLPVGFIYNASHQAVMDPDGQVQTSLRFFFETFRRTGSAMATVKAFRGQAVLFPRRLKKGLPKETFCGPSSHTAARFRCCTTHAMPALSFMDEPAREPRPMARTTSSNVPAENGYC